MTDEPSAATPDAAAAQPAATLGAAKAALTDSASGPVARIMVVDDEPDVEMLISQRFRRNIRKGEFAFQFAHNGEEALSLLAANGDVDLMLLDINMPVMDGLTLLGRLKELEAKVKAIIVSAYGDMTNIRTAMNRGAFDFVTKPIDMTDLETTIRKTLETIGAFREVEQRRQVAERARNNLSRYFSPSVVEMLAQRDEPLGPVRRDNVAVLFADMIGFTTMAENMTPEKVIGLLGEFSERMSAQVFACGGTIEKFIGDAMLATFGVPDPTGRDAHNALKCADLMVHELEGWNFERQAMGEPPVGIGIGLNYGPAVIGDIGRGRAVSFAVIGDTVNTASRLQTLTRALNAKVVASDSLITAIRATPDPDLAEALSRFQDRGEVALKGRAKPVRIWLEPRGTPAPAGSAAEDE